MSIPSSIDADRPTCFLLKNGLGHCNLIFYDKKEADSSFNDGTILPNLLYTAIFLPVLQENSLEPKDISVNVIYTNPKSLEHGIVPKFVNMGYIKDGQIVRGKILE